MSNPRTFFFTFDADDEFMDDLELMRGVLGLGRATFWRRVLMCGIEALLIEAGVTARSQEKR